MVNEPQNEPHITHPGDDEELTAELTEELTPPAHWPEGVPYQPVELFFTPEEEAAMDAEWEKMEAEWEAARQAAKDRRNARRRDLRQQRREQVAH